MVNIISIKKTNVCNKLMSWPLIKINYFILI